MKEINQVELSVVIPVYNNKESLALISEQIFSNCDSIIPIISYEVIFVDDGSVDGSYEILSTIQAANSKTVRVLKLSRNYGQVNALFAGYTHALGKAVITISADLQDPTDLIPQFYDEFRKGHDVVIGSRESRQDGTYRKITSYIAYRVARIGYPNLPSGGFDFFLISKKAVMQLLEYYGRSQFLQGSIINMGFEIRNIPYQRNERPFGKSQWTFRKKFRYLTDILIESTFAPIRFLTCVGLLIVAFSLISLLIIFWGKLSGNSPFNGFAALATLITAIGGTIILMIGILGEYLIRAIRQISPSKRFMIESEL